MGTFCISTLLSRVKLITKARTKDSHKNKPIILLNRQVIDFANNAAVRMDLFIKSLNIFLKRYSSLH